MDEVMDVRRLPHSFNSTGKHYNDIKGMKKRKLLQYETGSSSLRWPKHKHRDLSGILNQNKNSLDEEIDNQSDDEHDVISEADSNSFINGFHGNKLSLEMNCDTPANEPLVQEQQEPSQSSASSSSNAQVSKKNLYSLERTTQIENDRLHIDSDGKYVDIVDAELKDVTYTDEMLYSNNVPPFLLASGKWSFGSQDAKLGARKPTIDQEFEQYFSALML